MANVKITKRFNKRKSQIERDLRKLPKQANDFWTKTTPKRTGNARNKTSLIGGNTIFANYPYAGRLDDGYSKKAPKGMFGPTLRYVRSLVKKITK